MSKLEHPMMLIVLDGWGHSEATRYNAIHSARTPNWDKFCADYPHALILCSGRSVGLPEEQMGNSEVGHMHLGAGRTIDQDYSRISRAIEDRTFYDNEVLKTAIERAAKNGKAVHLLGLLSPGGVHSHEAHLLALLDFAVRGNIERIYIHAFLDGRDTPPKSAAPSLELIEKKCREIGVGRIASIVGRYYAMDRNKNWDRTKEAFELIVDGRALHTCANPTTALSEAYLRGETDEFVQSTAIVNEGSPQVTIEDGDLVVFANFRADRARQLTTVFTDQEFDAFAPTRRPKVDTFISLTNYGAQFNNPSAFPPIDLADTYGSWIAAQGLNQLRIAETEKYAHVTFFFNGGEDAPTVGEDRILIPSPDVATYDLKPEMSAKEVTTALVDAIDQRRYDTIICNYANADMVGHTGDFEATVSCVETLDECLGQVVAAAQSNGLEVLITADHGNAEKMRADGKGNEVAQAHTAHTSNLVPLVYIGRKAEIAADGCLSDIAPTMLTLMGLKVPEAMTGKNLITLSKDDQCAA